MTRQYSFEDRLSEWLEDGPVDAPDAVVETVIAAFPSIPQRRGVLRVPWRVPYMHGYARALAGIAAVAVVAVVALTLLNRQPAAVIGGPGSPSPSPSVAPAPSPTPINTATWKSFTSARHGVTTLYPSDWTAAAATAPWVAGVEAPPPPNAILDAFTAPGPNGRAFVVLSQPLPTGVTGASWLATYEQAGAAKYPPVCWPSADKMEQTTAGGQPAWIHGGVASCGFTEAIAFAGGRVYELTAYQDPSMGAFLVFDRALFDAFVSTVRLEPAKADDRPAPSVSPQPSSPAPS
jgi:hypothetical protein